MTRLRRLKPGAKRRSAFTCRSARGQRRLQSRREPDEQRRQRRETECEAEDAQIQIERQRQRRRLRLSDFDRRLERDYQIEQPRGEHETSRAGEQPKSGSSRSSQARTRRERLPPSATRTAISCWRAAARAISRLVTFMQASASTSSPTANAAPPIASASSSIRHGRLAGPAGPASPAPAAAAALCAAIATAACACSRLTPSFSTRDRPQPVLFAGEPPRLAHEVRPDRQRNPEIRRRLQDRARETPATRRPRP